MTTNIAIRYAQALFHFASKQKILKSVHRDITCFLTLYRAQASLRTLLQNPLQRFPVKEKILALFSPMVEKATLHFLLIVNRKGRAGLLSAMAQEFISLYKQHEKLRVAYVTSAHPLTEEIRNRLTILVQKLTGNTHVELITKVDASLLGGYVLRIGDRLLDASIRTRLRQLLRLWQQDDASHSA